MDEGRRKLALQLFSRAVEFLRDPMQEAISGHGHLEPVILSCLIFLVFEITMGNQLNAIRHARSGNSILHDRVDRHKRSGSVSSRFLQSLENPGEDRPRRASLDDTRICPSPQLKGSFQSLSEATVQLESLIDAGQDIRDELLRGGHMVPELKAICESSASLFCLRHTVSRCAQVDIKLLARLEDVKARFGNWNVAFVRMSQSLQFVSQELFLLQLRFFHASYLLAMCREMNEQLADRFADQFVRTVESAERVLKERPCKGSSSNEGIMSGPVAVAFMKMLHATSEQSSLGSDNSSTAASTGEETRSSVAGAFELGVLNAMFLVACKCRNSLTRHRAATLLAKYPRREAINSSETLAPYARHIIRLEERAAAESTGRTSSSADFYSDEVPGSARFLDVVASGLETSHEQFMLSCTRRQQGDDGNLELLEYECDVVGDGSRLMRDEMIRVEAMMIKSS